MNAAPSHLRLVPADGAAGRVCPYDYRYSPRVFRVRRISRPTRFT